MLTWALSHEQRTDVCYLGSAANLLSVWLFSSCKMHWCSSTACAPRLRPHNLLPPLSWFSCTLCVCCLPSDQLQSAQVHKTAWFPSALSARPCAYHREFLSEPGQLQHTSKAILARNQMKEPLIGSDWCIFTFYDQPSSKQLALLALERDFKYRPVHTQTHVNMRESTHTQMGNNFSRKQGRPFQKYQWHHQLGLFASHWFYNQVCCAMPGCCVFFSQSCRHSSSSSLQLKPCVVEKQASVCGEIACLEWEGAWWLQRSQSEHANSSWPSHAPCWWMHLNSQSRIPPHFNPEVPWEGTCPCCI